MDIGTKIVFVIYTVAFWVVCGICFFILIKDLKKCKEVPSYDFFFGRKSIRKVLDEKRDIQFAEIVAWIGYMLMFFPQQ